MIMETPEYQLQYEDFVIVLKMLILEFKRKTGFQNFTYCDLEICTKIIKE